MIKVTLPKEIYKDVEEFEGKYIVRVRKTENEDGTVTCYEKTVSTYPSEFASIEAEAATLEAANADKLNRSEADAEIEELKHLLSSTDYIAIKYAEGWISAEDYADTKAQRQAWRDRINELENTSADGE